MELAFYISLKNLPKAMFRNDKNCFTVNYAIPVTFVFVIFRKIIALLKILLAINHFFLICRFFIKALTVEIKYV